MHVNACRLLAGLASVLAGLAARLALRLASLGLLSVFALGLASGSSGGHLV